MHGDFPFKEREQLTKALPFCPGTRDRLLRTLQRVSSLNDAVGFSEIESMPASTRNSANSDSRWGLAADADFGVGFVAEHDIADHFLHGSLRSSKR